MFLNYLYDEPHLWGERKSFLSKPHQNDSWSWNEIFVNIEGEGEGESEKGICPRSGTTNYNKNEGKKSPYVRHTQKEPHTVKCLSIYSI